MNQDVALGVTTTITQADFPYLRAAGRLGEYAVVYRAYRQQMGGGFGDQEKNPFAWGVLVYVDTEVARVYSARGLPREWSDLTRLEKWLREQGFWYWWMRNDLEPLMLATADDDTDEVNPASEPVEATAADKPTTVQAEDTPPEDTADEDVSGTDDPLPSQTTRTGTGDADIVPLPTQMFRLVPKSDD